MSLDTILIQFLLSLPLSQFRQIVKSLSDKQAKYIKEIIVNLLAGNIDVTSQQKNRLSRYKVFLRKIAQSSGSGRSVIVKTPITLYKVLAIIKVALLDLIQ